LALASEAAPCIRIVGIEEMVRAAVRDVLAEQPNSVSPWLSVAEAAEYLRTTEHAIRAGVKRELPVHRTATGRLLFRRDELDAYATAGDA
jgi:excisionase family DNA binding protein